MTDLDDLRIEMQRNKELRAAIAERDERIEYLELVVANLQKSEQNYEEGMEYNAGLVVERDARIKELEQALEETNLQKEMYFRLYAGLCFPFKDNPPFIITS